MKGNKSLLIVLLAICISIFGISMQTQAEEIANGTCGDSATWTLDSEGTTEEEPEHEHSYENTFVWSDDYASCDAEFTCEECKDVQSVECIVESDVDGVICEEEVTVTYTASCEFEDTKYIDTKEVEIPAGHVYGEEPEWNWEEDLSKATLILECERCESKAIVECETTSNTTEATCTVDGKTVYTAACIHEGKRYSDTKEVVHPAPGHVFDSNPAWTWSDDCKEATATFTCAVCKEDEVKEATVTEYPETATCTQPGDVMYVATCTMNKTQYSYSKTITVDSLGHKYGEPEFVWDGDDAGKVTLTCEREDCDHVEVTEGTITTETIKPTCTENGKVILTGTCEVDGETYTATKEEELLAAGHTYGEWKVVVEATATTSGLEERTCTECGHSETRVIDLENPFVDVKESDYYYDAVLWAYENSITTGTDETHFSPDRACSRAEIVTFLWRANGCPKPETDENPFVDVEEDTYYYDAVLWAYENEITTGTDATHFSPDETCTRDQIVTFLWRAEGSPEPTIDNPFVDIKEGAYYYDAVLWAYENEITTGTDETHFAPGETCTRAQVVTFLYRTYEE